MAGTDPVGNTRNGCLNGRSGCSSAHGITPPTNTFPREIPVETDRRPGTRCFNSDCRSFCLYAEPGRDARDNPDPGYHGPCYNRPPGNPGPVKTTIVPATTPQPVTTPSALVPASGVFVKVTTTGKYSGVVGTPGRLREISDSGDHFYQISTMDGPVVVNLQKSDGTSAVFAIDVYKDGALMKHVQTSAPKGQIEFQTLLTAAATPTTAAAP